jgi:spermidine synthase
LDGVLKASSESGPASHESFVHPSMLAHPDPKKVLVFGSTTGATVKELLKHKSVEDVALVGVDKSILSFAQEKLHAWNDCSDTVNVTENCLDDTRVEAIYENPNMWLQNYRASSLVDKASALFDIIMVDFL